MRAPWVGGQLSCVKFIIVWLRITCALTFQVAFPIQVRHIHLRKDDKKWHQTTGIDSSMINWSTGSYLELQFLHSPLECSWPTQAPRGWHLDLQPRKAHLLSLNEKGLHLGPHNQKLPKRCTDRKKLCYILHPYRLGLRWGIKGAKYLNIAPA